MMRIRITFHGVILVLLVSLFPLISSVPLLIQDSQILDTDEHAPIYSLTEGNSEANLTWTSRTQHVPQFLENESIAVGDHVVLNATFPSNENITQCKMHLWDRFFFATTRPLVPTSLNGSFEMLIDPVECDWVTIQGFEIGDFVNVTANFTNSNCDFYAWDGSVNPLEYTRSNNLLNMESYNKPEHDSFIWSSENGIMKLACYNFDNTSIGNWSVYIEVGNHLTVIEEGSSIDVDTYYFINVNQTFSIKVTGDTDLNESFETYWENVEICNFFAPELPAIISTYTSDSIVYNISWNCEDQNQDDVNYYSIWLSRDDGYSFVLLRQNLTETWIEWSSSAWLEGDYIARVRAYSVDYSSGECQLDNPPSGYWPGDYSDAISLPFRGGDVGFGRPIPYFSINTNALSYEFGSTGNMISVHLSYHNRPLPLSIVYSVTDNGTLWIQEEYVIESSEESFTINIDGLSIGTHDLSIAIDYFGPYDREYLTVIVTTPTSSNTTTTETPQDWNQLLIQALVVGVSIGSVGIIVVVIRLKRN